VAVSASALLAILAFAASAREERVEILFSPTGEKRVLEERIAGEIRTAEREIRVAMYHFTSDRLLQALAERRRAGVSVAVLMDSSKIDDELFNRIRGARLELRLATPRTEGARFHHKFCVLDSRAVITGSYNWTVLGDVANHENVVLLRHDGAARAYRDEFDRLWNDRDLSRP
jgi:phosphatidylserine/phosphatidylglycerophosphate/cardiolipin synthase-like enzyme